MHRNRLKELWINRPTVLIPRLRKEMKTFPYKKHMGSYFSYLRSTIYSVWETSFEGGV